MNSFIFSIIAIYADEPLNRRPAPWLVPVILVFVCIVLLMILLFVSRQKKSAPKEQTDAAVKTAQEFVNAIDVKDIFLYTRDSYIIAYIKVQPISIELLSKNEKVMLEKKLTAEISSEQEAFKFLAVSRPVDITPLVSEYMELLSVTDNLAQKELLRNEIQVISNYSLSGEVVERQFYYQLWEKKSEHAENDLRKRTTEFSNKLGNAGLRTEILKESEIIRLCNLIDNPAYINMDAPDITPFIPILNNRGESV